MFRGNRTVAELAHASPAAEIVGSAWLRKLTRRNFMKGVAAAAGAAALRPAAAQAEETTTTVFTNGRIMTVDRSFSEAGALAIRGKKILAVGSDGPVRAAAGESARVVDLKGRVVLPGFVDPHTHMLTGAMVASTMDYVGVARFARTVDVLKHLAGLAAKASPGEWVVARNFDPSLQEGPDALTFRELDDVSKDHPVFVLNTSGHLAYANRKAFEVAGITGAVKNPPGAEFVRDSAGKLNGTIKNSVAFLRILEHNPALARTDPVRALTELTAKFARLGLTTLSDLGMGALTGGPGDWSIYQKAGANAGLSARLRVYPFYTLDEEWDKVGVKPRDGNEMVRIAGYKLVADGSNQGLTGLQREPYLGSDDTGLAYASPEELKRLVLKRGRQGWPLAVHGNGDKAIDHVLDAYEAARNAGLDLAKLRPRIEHCSILHEEQIARMKKLGVSASFLIGHVHFWGVAFRDKIFGLKKAKLLDRARSCEKAGVSFTLHSDFMVTDPNPLQMIEMAVTRRTWKEPDFVLAPDERISVESAIRSLTSEAAWQLNSEHEIGSLEPGKFADFVVLDRDPRKVEPTTIKKIEVLETWLNGKQTFAL
jgi:hypothetical protein